MLELGQALRDLQVYIDDDEESEARRQHRNFNYRKRLCECSPNGEISGLPHVFVSADGTLDFSDLALIYDFLSSHTKLKYFDFSAISALYNYIQISDFSSEIRFSLFSKILLTFNIQI